MSKRKNMLLTIAAIVIVGCLLYIPQMKDLGLYRDDWNNFYNLTVRGPRMLIEAYNLDRPADGYLISLLYWFFGTNFRAYMIWNLCCRILGSVFFALALLRIWPKTSKMAGLAGLLAVAFPGFLQQVDGIAYVPHQTAMMCFMLSLWLTALACEPGQKSWNVLFTFLSILFSFASMMLMEYYIGMEIYRLFLIYLMNREQAGKGKPRSFFQSVFSYIPYVIPAAAFVAWRVFFFQAERAGADLIDVLRPYKDDLINQMGDLVVRTIKSIWKLFAGTWTVPLYNIANGLSMRDFMKALIPALFIFAIGQLFLFLLHRKKTEDAIMDAGNEAAQWLWYGLICGTVAILPLIVAGRDINFSASLDRFTWPGMIGAILFLIGLLGSLRSRILRNILTMSVILISVFVQWQNQVNYASQWKMAQDYWQQLMWRAPALKEKATIVTGGALLVEEDYDVFAPASMIYFPGEIDFAPVGAEVLNSGTVRDVILGKNSGRYVREIFVNKNYDQLLAISKPTAEGCLRIIDGDAPIYSTMDWTKIPQIGEYSRLSQIITNPASPAVRPFFLKEELEHGWCYYFAKMELALQQGDAQTAAKLADEAAAKQLKAIDPVEWIPVIEAYARAGRMDDALEIVQVMRSDELLEHNACYYFRAKEETGDFGEIISILCGWMHADEPAAPEADMPVDTDAPAEIVNQVSSETTDAAETFEKNSEEAAEEVLEETKLPVSGDQTEESVSEALEDNKNTQEELDNVL